MGDVFRLQRDYFTFMSWLYISPFICDLRTRAVVGGGNIFHYPLFAIIYGKANCGKTSLVDTLITSMFGHPSTVQKDNFTRRTLRGLQQKLQALPGACFRRYYPQTFHRPWPGHRKGKRIYLQ